MTSGNEGAITGGVYISQDYWNKYFGSNYTNQIPIVVRDADSPYCPSDCTPAANDFNSYYADMVIDGYKVIIWWQSYPTACGGDQDLDITPETGCQNSKWEPTPYLA
ncbi:MAG: hypothetical protein M1415_11645 [Firmicutes bacterium]|nr:hypothetical protein [Bacillota bacterium]